MIRNYLKIAIRNLLKQRVYSVINIVGLSVGLASCLLILLFVQDEFSYDKFHTNADRIFKIALERKYPTHATFYAVIPHSFADAIEKDFAEVETVTRMGGPFNNVLVSYQTQKGDEKQFEENNVMSADSSFFDVFSVKLLKGDRQTVIA
ncbi:MAG: ABC transporter permease [Bacteroidia bacterium]|nr:ABC transporter permease [Bacteroidia bacterium]